MKIPETKRFIPKGFEYGYKNWSIVYFPAKLCLKTNTFLNLMGTKPIDLFSLYILFSHFRPRDITVGKTFFQMSSYAREYVRITYEKTKGKFP